MARRLRPEVDEPAIFRIDTVTGETWRYLEIFDKDKSQIVAGWIR